MQNLGAIFIAFNAENTLVQFYNDFPKEKFKSIILVDDASSDNTFELAQRLGITAYRNPQNLGYGGNLKRALQLAIDSGVDIVVDIHPDGEYLPTAIPQAIQSILTGSDFVVGNRFSNYFSMLSNGMYWWKIIPIILMNAIARITLNLKIRDVHQGFRVYSTAMLKKLDFNKLSNDYLFSFEFLVLVKNSGFQISEVHVQTNYSGSRRGASLSSCFKYSFGVLRIILNEYFKKLFTHW